MTTEPFQYRGGWYLWYLDHTGKRKHKLLAKTKREAYARWKEGLRSGTVSHSDALFRVVADKWLSAQEKRLELGTVSAKWVNRVSRTVEAFTKANPRVKCSQINETVAVDWLPDGCEQAYIRTEVQVIKQVLRWAVGRHIERDPLAGMKLEKGKRREVLISIEDHRRLVRLAKPDVGVLLWFCWWLGCRPIELRELRWEYVVGDCEAAVLREHRTAKNGKSRTLYFPPNAQAILKRHRKTNGYVFVNTRGQPWTKDALCKRVRWLKEKTGVDVSAYVYRHTFITRAMVQGLHAAVVAELAGTSVEMIARHYGHLEQARSHLVEAARGIRS